MDNQNTNESPLFGITLDENSKQSLRGAATMGGVSAILFISGLALSVIAFIVQLTRPRQTELEGFERFRSSQPAMGFVVFWELIVVGVYILLFYFLNRFATLTKTGISNNSQQQVSDGLGSLASYFKTLGILLIIFLSLAILGLILGSLGRMNS